MCPDIWPDIRYTARADIRYPAKLLAGYPVAGYLAKSVSGATLNLYLAAQCRVPFSSSEHCATTTFQWIH